MKQEADLNKKLKISHEDKINNLENKVKDLENFVQKMQKNLG